MQEMAFPKPTKGCGIALMKSRDHPKLRAFFSAKDFSLNFFLPRHNCVDEYASTYVCALPALLHA